MDENRAAQYWNARHFDPSFAREEWSFHPASLARLAALLGSGSREEWFWERYLRGRSNLKASASASGLAGPNWP